MLHPFLYTNCETAPAGPLIGGVLICLLLAFLFCSFMGFWRCGGKQAKVSSVRHNGALHAEMLLTWSSQYVRVFHKYIHNVDEWLKSHSASSVAFSVLNRQVDASGISAIWREKTFVPDRNFAVTKNCNLYKLQSYRKLSWVYDFTNDWNKTSIRFGNLSATGMPVVSDDPCNKCRLLQVNAVSRGSRTFQTCLRGDSGLLGLIPDYRSRASADESQQYADSQRGVVKPISLHVNSGDCANRYLWVGAVFAGFCCLIALTFGPGVYCVLNGRRLRGFVLIGFGGCFAVGAAVLSYWGISQQNKCTDKQYWKQTFHSAPFTSPSDLLIHGKTEQSMIEGASVKTRITASKNIFIGYPRLKFQLLFPEQYVLEHLHRQQAAKSLKLNRLVLTWAEYDPWKLICLTNDSRGEQGSLKPNIFCARSPEILKSQNNPTVSVQFAGARRVAKFDTLQEDISAFCFPDCSSRKFGGCLRGSGAYESNPSLPSHVGYAGLLQCHAGLHLLNAIVRGFCSLGSLFRLFGDSQKGQDDSPSCRPVWPSKEAVPTWNVPFGIAYVFLGMLFVRFSSDSILTKVCGILCALLGGAFVLTGYVDCQPQNQGECSQVFQHDFAIVPQEYLDNLQLLGYSNSSEANMANVLNTDKQIAVIGALTEGSSIRSIERMTGVHRDTIMRLGVRVGEGCARLMNSKMRNLPCTRLEMDEIWGFVGKKDRNVRLDETAVGSVWTFCAIDAETKLVPAFKVGDRGIATARAFVSDVASRMRNRVQISTDGLRAYVEAVENAFGAEVDYAQIVKTYGHEEVSDNRRYSAPEFVSSEKKVITGNPDERLISTSYVERLNATTRLHMRRLTRLTLAFSKKRENFEAAVALHFAYYNFVKRHNTLRCTPAMAAGVEQGFWSVGDLLEATA